MDKVVKYRNVTQNLSVAIIFFVFSFLIEIISSLVIMQSLPSMIMSGVSILFFISFILFILPNKYFRTIVAIFLVTLQCVLSIVNEILYRTTSELFTLSKIALAGNVLAGEGGGGSVFTMSMLRWEIILLFVAILAIFIITLITSPKHYKTYKPTRKAFLGMMTFSIFMFSTLTCIATVPLAYRPDLLTMISTQCPVNSSYKNYGYYTFYTFNIASNIVASLDNSEIDENIYFEYLTEDSQNIENYYTGISEGNNVILILCESVETFGIDEYFTPNLYNLMYNNPYAMNMTSYYTDNKTNMSEGSSFLGTYSANYQLAATGSSELCDALDSISLPNKIKQSDPTVTANYYHGLTSSFYHRNTTFNKLGFDNLYFGQTQEDDIKAYNSQNNKSYDWTTRDFYSFIKDSNFIEYNIESFIPETGRFYSQYATLSTHGTYEERGANKEFYDILTSDENKSHYNDMISNLVSMGYNLDSVKKQFPYYKAAMMDLDKTIGIIMDRLATTNHLDDTTMVLFADHNAYYDSISWKIKNASATDVSAFNLPCIIYDKKMTEKYREVESVLDDTKSVQNDSFMSVLDIYPTLCNVLGLNYNTKLCYGKSVFEKAPHVFITFKDTGHIFNDEFLYDSGTTFSQSDNDDSSEFDRLKSDILHKFNIQENLYKHPSSFAHIMNNIYT